MKLAKAWTQGMLVAGGALAAVSVSRAQTIPPVPGASVPAEAASAAATARQSLLPPSTYVVPSVAVLATQTSNANFGTGAPVRSDTVLQVIPRLLLHSQHARWSLDGNLGLTGSYYVSGVQPNLISPAGAVNLHTEWVKDLLFLDAGFSAAQQSISPYQGQAESVPGSRYTSTQWRISPYIDRLLRPGLRVRARSDDTWTRVSNTPSQTGLFGGRYLDQQFSIEQAPRRLGYAVAARQTYATYDGEPYAWLRDTTFRVAPSLALGGHAALSLIGGRERVQAYTAQQDNTIYGARLQWHPALTASLDAIIEHRFFGTGWSVLAGAGTPQARMSLRWSRDAASGLAPLGSTSSALAGGNIAELLTGLLSTQYPDPLQRARVVQNLLGDSGLPAGLSTAGGFYTTSSLLQNSLVLTGLLVRQRNSYALSIYRNRTEDLFLPGQDVLRLLQITSNDNLQTGLAFNYGRRLSPLDNLNLTLQQENDSGFGLNQGLSARQRSAIVQLDHRLSTRTTALVGLRRQVLTSTRVLGSTETAVFGGLVHRF
jgi:uncharacterized protein (PEP-CTERM system associated)